MNENVKYNISIDGNESKSIDELNTSIDPQTRFAMTKDLEELVIKKKKLNENTLLTEVTPNSKEENIKE